MLKLLCKIILYSIKKYYIYTKYKQNGADSNFSMFMKHPTYINKITYFFSLITLVKINL